MVMMWFSIWNIEKQLRNTFIFWVKYRFAIAKHTIDYEATGAVSDEPDVIVNRCTGKFFIYDAIDEKYFTK